MEEHLYHSVRILTVAISRGEGEDDGDGEEEKEAKEEKEVSREGGRGGHEENEKIGEGTMLSHCCQPTC